MSDSSGDPSADPGARYRPMWWIVVASAALALGLHLYDGATSAQEGRDWHSDWVSPAGILALGLAGVVGRRNRVLQVALWAVSVALLIAALVLVLRR